MKSFYHPPLSKISLKGILKALSDPDRIVIYINIAAADCPQICAKFLKIKNKKLPKSTLSKHFGILREAGLIRSEMIGVEMHNTTRCEEIKKKFGGLLMGIIEAYNIENCNKTTKAKSK